MKHIYLLQLLSAELAALALVAFGIVVYQALLHTYSRDDGPARVATIGDDHGNMEGIPGLVTSDFRTTLVVDDGISSPTIEGTDAVQDGVSVKNPQQVRRARGSKSNTIGSRIGIPDVVLTDNGAIFDLGRTSGIDREIDDR